MVNQEKPYMEFIAQKVWQCHYRLDIALFACSYLTDLLACNSDKKHDHSLCISVMAPHRISDSLT